MVERGLTVYLHDNNGISRAPTLLLGYLCLYVKIRTYENLPEAQKLIQSYHGAARPNLKIVKLLLHRCGGFQESQKLLMKGEFLDQEEGDLQGMMDPAESPGRQKFLTEITPNYYGEDRKQPIRVYMRDMAQNY